jgi:hypothetical protein
MDGCEADGTAEPYGPTRQIRACTVTFWIGLVLSACALAILVLMSWRRRILTAELGTVSAQWLSEHRGYDGHYSER